MENKRIATLSAQNSIVEDVPMPRINENQMLIRNTFVGVCMSEHDRWATATGRVCFGHEPVGVVEAVGKQITDWKVGDRVGGLWGNPLPGGGGMVRYTVVNPAENCLIHLPDDIRDEDLLVEPLACLISAVSKARVNIPGTEVCVVGSGYMGCGAISLLKLRGAFVTAVDIRPECLRDAQTYGADKVLSVEEAEQLIADGFRGFDVVMEWGETEESLDLAARLTAKCGQLCVGAYHTGAPRRVNMQLLNVRAIDCLSTHPRERDLNFISARNAVKLLESGRWNFKNIPTMVYPMNQFDRAQAELKTKYGKYMKAVIDMSRLDGEPYVI